MDAFEEHRALLQGMAYRMCGVLADAQDIVQETHLRWNQADRSEIREPRAWLVTVCSRLAMDLMKSARVRRENYVGTWLPELFLDEQTANPAERTHIDETISMALMLALEKLSPPERAAFLLHEVFGYGFDEVAGVIGKSEPACRKLASRARAAVHDARPRYPTTPAEHGRLLDAFFQAAQTGEVANLEALLAESVELHADGGGKVRTAPAVLRGAKAVAEFFAQVWRENALAREDIRIVTRWFNGSPGVLIYQGDGLVAALSLAIEAGAIRRIFAMRNPDKLTGFGTRFPG